MSMLGFITGMGDAAEGVNRRREADSAKRREMFAQDLQRVMESEDWPEQSRLAAAKMRMQLFSNPKIKEKDYEKMWGEIHNASARPGVESDEVAAARSNIPALQNLKGTFEGMSSAVPNRRPDSLTMRPSPTGGGLMDLMRPPASEEEERSPVPSNLLTMRPEPQTNNLLAPPSITSPEVVDRSVTSNQRTIAANPTATLYGPITLAEKNKMAMEQLRQNSAVQLGMYRAQKDIDAEYKPSAKWNFDSKRGLMWDENTGKWEAVKDLPPAEMDPDKKTELQSIVSDILASRGLQDTAANRVAVTEEWLKRKSGFDNDPESAYWKQMGVLNSIAQREALEQNNLEMRSRALTDTYLKAREQASMSVRYAQALKQAVNDASLGGDLWAIFSAMRALDPGSVVREQEYRVGQSLGGPIQSAIGKMNQIMAKGILSSAVRSEFEHLADNIIAMANNDYKSINDLYMSVAEARGVPLAAVPFAGPSSYVPGSTQPAFKPYQPVRPNAGGGGRTAVPPPGQSASPSGQQNQQGAFGALVNELIKGWGAGGNK